MTSDVDLGSQLFFFAEYHSGMGTTGICHDLEGNGYIRM